MKSLKLIMVIAFAAMGFSAMAQDVNFDDPKYAKWGANAAERQQNMLNSQFLKEAVDNRKYDVAAGYLVDLLKKCPEASQNLYTNGTTLPMIQRYALSLSTLFCGFTMFVWQALLTTISMVRIISSIVRLASS